MSRHVRAQNALGCVAAACEGCSLCVPKNPRWPRGAAVADWDGALVEVYELSRVFRGLIYIRVIGHDGMYYARPRALTPLTPLARALLAVAREGR